MAEKNKSNGWHEWGKHVLAELKRAAECDTKLFEKVSDIDKKLSVLETKVYLRTGIISIIVGSIPSIIAVIWVLIKFSNLLKELSEIQ